VAERPGQQIPFGDDRKKSKSKSKGKNKNKGKGEAMCCWLDALWLGDITKYGDPSPTAPG